MIPVRITCNSGHTILSYCFEIKRENTSGDRKISFEKWRCSKYVGSNYGKSFIRVLLGIFNMPGKYFQQKRCSNYGKSNYREPTVQNILSTNFSNMICN